MVKILFKWLSQRIIEYIMKKKQLFYFQADLRNVIQFLLKMFSISALE
jgi:hypothetical protein